VNHTEAEKDLRFAADEGHAITQFDYTAWLSHGHNAAVSHIEGARNCLDRRELHEFSGSAGDLSKIMAARHDPVIVH
jgi:hypothetical protein